MTQNKYALMHKKSTKNMEVFENNESPVPTLYVSKKFFKGAVPHAITITLEYPKESKQ